MAGYSATPLPKKLGIKAGNRFALLGAPATIDAVLGELPAGVEILSSLKGKAPFDVILFLPIRLTYLRLHFPCLLPRLNSACCLCISRPKPPSRVATDLTENVVRHV